MYAAIFGDVDGPCVRISPKGIGRASAYAGCIFALHANDDLIVSDASLFVPKRLDPSYSGFPVDGMGEGTGDFAIPAGGASLGVDVQ